MTLFKPPTPIPKRRITTVIIAANDSRDKDKADYVCTGTSDNLLLNKIFASYKGFVGFYLMEGTYNVNGKVNLIEWGVGGDEYWHKLLIGAGKGTIIKGNGPLWFGGTRLYTVANLAIDGVNRSQIGIFLEGAHRCRVINCYIKNCKYGIRVEGYSSYSIISNNIVEDCNVGIAADVHTSFASITDNIIYPAGTGIGVSSSSSYNIIANNHIYHSWYGLRASSGNPLNIWDGNIIEEPSAGGGTVPGIAMEEANNIIVGNTVKKAHADGIGTRDYTIVSSNTLRDTGGRADNTQDSIRVAGDYNAILGNIVQETLDKRAKYGIEEEAGKNHNNILGNIVQGARTANILTVGANTIKQHNIE